MIEQILLRQQMYNTNTNTNKNLYSAVIHKKRVRGAVWSARW